ncbi:MAG: hypothetical protein WCY62_01075 [Clostridia bacterium]
MTKRKYFILALVIAVLLTAVQIAISKYAVKSDEGYIYVANREIQKGDTVTVSDLQKITVYGYTGEIIFTDNMFSLLDIRKGDVVNTSCFDNAMYTDKDRMISVTVDADRSNGGNIRGNETVDIYVIPDMTDFQPYEMKWLEEVLSSIDIAYLSDKDVGFMLNDVWVDDVITQNAGSSIVSLRVASPTDILLSFLKNKCDIEFIVTVEH